MESFQICPVTNYYQRILVPVSYSLEFMLGLSLNGVLLWCVCCRTRRWYSTVIYIANLTVADLLYVLVLPPLIISKAMGDAWPFGNIICKGVRFFFLVNLHCSMMFLTCISVHRFFGVCFPIATLRFRTRKAALFASSTVWILVTVETFPTLVYAHTGMINNATVCFEFTDPWQFKAYYPYGLFLEAGGFLLPFLLVIACNCSMIKVLYSKAEVRICARTARMRNRSVCILLVVFLVFVLCFGPYHVGLIVYLFVRVYRPADCDLLNTVMISFKVWKPVVGLNCCANPLLYFWVCGEHRQKLRAWLRRLRRRRRRVQPGMSLTNRQTEVREHP